MQSKFVILFFIALFGSIGHFVTDIYLPSMPYMAEDLYTSDRLVQATISVYMISFALSAVIFGFYSDVHGRKHTIGLGLTIMIAASMICFFASSIYVFLLGRIMQAFGAAAVAVSSRALLADYFEGQELIRSISITATFVPLFLAIAPFIGSYIHEFFSWRHIFIFLILLFLVMLYYDINHLKNKQDLGKFDIENIASAFGVLKNKYFILYSLYVAIYFMGIASFITIGSFLFQDILGLNHIEFGRFNLMIGLTLLLSSYINITLSKIIPPRKIIIYAISFPILSSIIILVAFLLESKNIVLYGVACTMYFFAAGFSFANSVGLAYSFVKSNRGFASSFITFCQLSSGATISFTLSYLKDNSFLELSISFGLCSLIMLLILYATRTARVSSNKEMPVK